MTRIDRLSVGISSFVNTKRLASRCRSAPAAHTVSAAVAESTAPIACCGVDKDSTGSRLAVVTDAKNGLHQARSAPVGEGLRSAVGSALLDHPPDPDRELEPMP
jgi:hypothetical protein